MVAGAFRGDSAAPRTIARVRAHVTARAIYLFAILSWHRQRLLVIAEIVHAPGEARQIG